MINDQIKKLELKLREIVNCGDIVFTLNMDNNTVKCEVNENTADNFSLAPTFSCEEIRGGNKFINQFSDKAILNYGYTLRTILFEYSLNREYFRNNLRNSIENGSRNIVERSSSLHLLFSIDGTAAKQKRR